MSDTFQELAQHYRQRDFSQLTAAEQAFIREVASKRYLSRDVNAEFENKLTLGQRVADRVATFGGSWTFILLFGGILLNWVVLNTFVLAKPSAFDPFPYILLNLVLSMLAAIQAPIIMMSQNRQTEKDRLVANNDYLTDAKAEHEIEEIQAKLNQLLEGQWAELISLQQQQLDLLETLRKKLESPVE